MRNQTVPCPTLSYDQSTMKPACCCRGLIRCGHSEPQERAAEAQGGPQNTGPFPALAVLPWAAAPSGPWQTRVETERTGHSPQPSSWRHPSWIWENVLKVEMAYCSSFILQSEAIWNSMTLQDYFCYSVWFLNPEDDHVVNSGSCQQIELNSSISHKPEGKEVVPAEIT